MNKMSTVFVSLIVGLLIGFASFAFVGKVFETKPSVESTTLSEGFKSIAELSVEEYYFTDIAKIDESANLLGKDLPFTNKKLLLVYKGYAKAGIRNYKDVNFSIDHGSRKIIVKAPKVEVLETKIDNSNVERYDETSGLFNPINSTDLIDLFAKEEAEAKEKAINAGILDRAKTRAEEILISNVKGIISGTEQEGYTVEVQWVG